MSNQDNSSIRKEKILSTFEDYFNKKIKLNEAEFVLDELEKLPSDLKNIQPSALKEILKKSKIPVECPSSPIALIPFKKNLSSKVKELKEKKIKDLKEKRKLNEEKYKTVFDLFDTEKKGTIDSKTLKENLEQIGFGTNPTIDEILESIKDKKKDTLDFSEFLEIMSGGKDYDLHNKKDLLKLYKKYDTDGDGLIGEEDLLNIRDIINDDAQLGHIKRMMEVADITEDKQISFEDFYYIFNVSNENLRQRKNKLDKDKVGAEELY